MNSKSKGILDYLKKANVKRFVLFFVLTFVFLVFSKLSTKYRQTIKIKVELANASEEIVLKNDSLNMVDAFVETNGFALTSFMFNEYKTITIDAGKDVTQGATSYLFDTQKHKYIFEEQLGDSYKLISIKPDTLLLDYFKMASKLVPIKLKTDIKYAIGYDLKDEFVISTDSVRLVGPKSEIDSISFLNTELLEKEGIKAQINETLRVNSSELNNIEVYPKSISARGEVVRFTEGVIDAPIAVINKPNDVTINYFPKTVKISYYVDLERYNSISVEDFVIECDYDKIGGSQSFFIPKLTKKPEFIKRVQLKQKRIEFIKL